MCAAGRVNVCARFHEESMHEKIAEFPQPKSCRVVCVCAWPLMIYVLIEFHLTGIDFFSNGKY